MIEGPIGAAAFNNEFGRPGLCGYFRTFEAEAAGVVRGYHKPIMLAGGLGNIRAGHSAKAPLPAGTLLLQLGGPGMLIGMGGGAASSMGGGANLASLDFDSVQRGNAEIQRRAQQVIDRCWQLGDANPILSIHDVGAGGLSNAVPEMVHAAGRGARVSLRDIPVEDAGMSPREIWCNEAQERYVLAVSPQGLPRFKQACDRERCPFAVIGNATDDGRLLIHDAHCKNNPVDIDLSVIIGERAPLALLDGPASGRMAVGEAITNLAAARIASLGSVKLSANWMAAAGYPGEDAALYDTVRAVALELCPALGISIPVGKDSLSMRTAWDGKEVVAPLSLIVSAFAPVEDARGTLTPQLRSDAGDDEQLAGRAKDLVLAALFCEELGAVLQVRASDRPRVMQTLRDAGLGECSHLIGQLNPRDEILITRNGKQLYSNKRDHVQRTWSETTWRMQALRDHPACAREEFDRIIDPKDPGLSVHLTFQEKDIAPATGVRPRIAILRKQGVNGHVEMPAAFDRAGFEAVDVHRTDLTAGRASLAWVKRFPAGGGVPYGDLLGAARG